MAERVMVQRDGASALFRAAPEYIDRMGDIRSFAPGGNDQITAV
jgi:hypothetical protein